MICDQLNLDKNNQMTLGVTGKSNKRMKTIEGLKNGKNNLNESNGIDEDNLFFTNPKPNNIISKRNGTNVPSKKKSNYDTNVDKKYKKKNKFGILKWKDGDSYEGYFENDNFKGYGKYFTESTGSKYKGQFLNNQINGFGEEEWKNGSKFEGEYAHQIKKGIGILTLNDSKNYKGQFDNNNFNGYGTLSINNGEILIQGFFKNNIIQDYAIYKNIQENIIYEGKISDNLQFNGFGILFDNNDNKIYISNWKNNILDGDCIIISNNNNEKNTQKFLFEDGEMKKEYNNNKTTIFDKIIEQLL